MNGEMQYILDAELREIPCQDVIKWAMWCETADRHVGGDLLGPYWISTVFLGLDHNYAMSGPPLLYETMIFKIINPPHIMQRYLIERYATWNEAKEGHDKAVEAVKAGTLPS